MGVPGTVGLAYVDRPMLQHSSCRPDGLRGELAARARKLEASRGEVGTLFEESKARVGKAATNAGVPSLEVGKRTRGTQPGGARGKSGGATYDGDTGEDVRGIAGNG